MISVTNKSNRNAIIIAEKTILPQTSELFDKIDTKLLDYYISTGDIEIQYCNTDSKKSRYTARKPHSKDTIIIDSNNTLDDDSNNTEPESKEDKTN